MFMKFKLSKEFSTKERCLEQVKKDGSLIRFVPKYFLTKEMCRIAVQEDSFNLRFIPDSFKDYEILKIAEDDEWAVIFYPQERFDIKDLDLLTFGDCN